MIVRLSEVVQAAGITLHALRPGARESDPLVSGVAFDTQRVEPGSVFCCVRGSRFDGHEFASQAVAAGSVALLCDHVVGVDVPQVIVADVRTAMGPFAAAFHRYPSRSLDVFGVTGTNGKTTTVHLVTEIGRGLGLRAEMIGTLTGVRTTPEAPDLQAHLAAARDHHTQLMAIEVSSHALAQHRVDGTRFTAVAFTNLTPDHLDFHGDMERYYEAKRRLFDGEFSDTAVIDAEGSYASRLLSEVSLPHVVRSGAGTVGIRAIGLRSADFIWRGERVLLPLGGRFNVSNATVAADLMHAAGHDAASVAAALSAAAPVPGRFEPVDAGQSFAVIVDYAHTPDGLARVLAAAREAVSGRVIVVFGCGGDRDVAKRPLMGVEAERGADVVIVTSDNPRSEDPDAIIRMILTGIRRTAHVEPDRRAAIAYAFDIAAPGDAVVIAGKGHETTQTIGEQSFPFDDRAVARELLATGSGR